MTTKTKTKYPGITKITYKDNTTASRLIIVVGSRIDHEGKRRDIQECHTFKTLLAATDKQAEIRDARKRHVFVKRETITFDGLCQRWLDSRHDVREVTVVGYRHALRVARELMGQ